jgi:hypothetical protein
MTAENDTLCEDLRAWMKSPAIGLPDYAADPSVQRRVGRILAKLDAKFSLNAARELVVNPIQIRLPDEV